MAAPAPHVARRPAARYLVIAGAVLLIGLLGWALLRPAPAQAKRLPALALERLEGGSVSLEQATGKPVVINLWATWCPPCRRELPMLAAAARQNPEVSFFFADQGESRETVSAYLQERPEMVLEGVLLDSASRLSVEFEAMGLPVTLFFDATGKHVLSHVGEVSEVDMLNYLSDLKRGRL